MRLDREGVGGTVVLGVLWVFVEGYKKGWNIGIWDGFGIMGGAGTEGREVEREGVVRGGQYWGLGGDC